jgi:hypothetical protein
MTHELFMNHEPEADEQENKKVKNVEEGEIHCEEQS